MTRAAGSPSSAALPVEQYVRVFAVLEQCDAARTIDEFKGVLLESLASVFGFHHMTCFSGSSIESAFYDQHPSLLGSCTVSWPAYQEHWHRYDPLSTVESCQALRVDRFSDLTSLTSLPTWARGYIDGHMRKWGYRSSAAMHLELPLAGHALVGITDPEPDLVSASDGVALGLLARHLSPISRRLPTGDTDAAWSAGLSERLREVAVMVCEGRANKEIATQLCLSLDTVKKYVSRILASTGCRSRAEFVARYAGSARRHEGALVSASSHS
jgi:DNA-binding CsgD family transcriptional regulator